MASQFSVDTARSKFPALRQDQVFMDNAGGSQTLDSVADAIRQYLVSTNVQLGASYPISSESTRQWQEGYDAAAKYVNAKSSEIVLGGAATQLFGNLASSLYEYLSPGDEIVLSQLDHEANVGSWVRLAERRNVTIKWWKGSFDSDRHNPLHTGENLKPLLSSKTKFVSCTHTSNILGSIHDIAGISKVIRETAPGALFCVDGVAYAPHRAVDVTALGVDFYCFSWYKVYGPHISLLYASTQAQEKLTSLGHYFKGPSKEQPLETKLGHAASTYELTASIPKIVEYLEPVEQTWAGIAQHEEDLSKLVIDWLKADDRITILGQPVPDKDKRVPVISFLVKGFKSQNVTLEVEKKSHYGIRYGHFYSHRLVDGLYGLGDDGVVRISLVHYNTAEEVKGLLKVLDEVLKQ